MKRLFFISTIVILVITSSVSFASLRMPQNNTHKAEYKLSKKKFASSRKFKNDTISKENYKLSKKEFLSRYAIDDTSRALIKYYFNKRGDGEALTVLFSLATFGELLLISVTASINSYDDIIGSLAIIATALYTIIIYIPALLFGGLAIHRFKKFSRRNLYIQLMNHQSGKGIDPKILKEMNRNKLCWKK